MIISKNISLKHYNTFGLDYNAECMVRVRTEKEAISLFRGEIYCRKPLLILGGGSNILFTGDFKGTILLPEFKGIRIEKEEGKSVIISAGAGVVWDKLVEWTVEKGLGGLENLSLIPGKVGAVPVQNIGAYGVEVKDTIIKVRTISAVDGSVRIFTNKECDFGYRTSIFKHVDKGRYLITRVWFRLSAEPVLNISYGSLHDEVAKLGGVTLKNLREAVIQIRQSKLPDPEVTGNAGSFFKNPVVNPQKAEELKKKFPGIPCYDDPSGGSKLAAGWMIEQCGWQVRITGKAGVHEKQALVLVNSGGATGKDIFDLSETIKESVNEKFGVELEREVEVI
ncbi:MAG: UDP-N-acetylenolpyruvoylglucosamine reductase [Bacteroidota bacterium]|nr:UDP-N-acetylenolpyruvoylglucosamine reductase [Bacteroidota bacterium]